MFLLFNTNSKHFWICLSLIVSTISLILLLLPAPQLVDWFFDMHPNVRQNIAWKAMFSPFFGWGIGRGHLKHHFELLWARITFLITENWLFEIKNDPQNDLFFGHFKVKIGHFWGSFWSSKSRFSVIRNEILAHNSSKWCLRCPLPIPHPKTGRKHRISCDFLSNVKKKTSLRYLPA